MPVSVLERSITYCIRLIQFLASVGRPSRCNNTRRRLLLLLSAVPVVQAAFRLLSEKLAPCW